MHTLQTLPVRAIPSAMHSNAAATIKRQEYQYTMVSLIVSRTLTATAIQFYIRESEK